MVLSIVLRPSIMGLPTPTPTCLSQQQESALMLFYYVYVYYKSSFAIIDFGEQGTGFVYLKEVGVTVTITRSWVTDRTLLQ